MKQSSKDENDVVRFPDPLAFQSQAGALSKNDEARVHRELGGGGGRGRDSRSSILVMQSGINLQRRQSLEGLEETILSELLPLSYVISYLR